MARPTRGKDDCEHLARLTLLANQKLFEARPQFARGSTVSHFVFRAMAQELEKNAGVGIAVVRAAYPALTQWTEDHYTPRNLKSGLKAGSGRLTNPGETIKQWRGSTPGKGLNTPWMCSVDFGEGDWYVARLEIIKDDSRGVVTILWQFLPTDHRTDVERHRQQLEERFEEGVEDEDYLRVTQSDIDAAPWFEGVEPAPPTLAPVPGEYQVTVTTADLRAEAEHFLSFCRRLDRRGTFDHPERRRRNQVSLTVKWPTARRRRNVFASTVLLLLLCGGCAKYVSDRIVLRRMLSAVMISVGSRCDSQSGTTSAWITVAAATPPPLLALRDDEVLGEFEMRGKSDDGLYHYGFSDQGTAPESHYTYRAAKAMWLTGEQVTSSVVSTTTPRCRKGNRDPEIGRIEVRPRTVQVGEPVVVTVIDASDADGDVLTYRWNSGEEARMGRAVDAFVYSTPGEKVVGVTVDDQFGGITVAQTTVTVLGTGHHSNQTGTIVDSYLFGRVEPESGERGGTFTITAEPPAVADCREDLMYRFSFEARTQNIQLESPWQKSNRYIIQLEQPDTWFVSYTLQCGSQRYGPYSLIKPLSVR